MADPTKIDLCYGKYTVVLAEKGELSALRYGEPWRDLCGDNLVYWMVVRIQALEAENKELKLRVPQ
jgi:hypothetical protein